MRLTFLVIEDKSSESQNSVKLLSGRSSRRSSWTLSGWDSTTIHTHTHTDTHLQGNTDRVATKIGEKKSPSFSGFSRAINLLFHRLSQQRSKCNNDLHQGSFHINSSNTTGHHRTLTSFLFLMILFTQSTAVLHKHLNDELKILCLLQFFPQVAWNSREFLEFSIFREIPEYSRFSRFVATLIQGETKPQYDCYPFQHNTVSKHWEIQSNIKNTKDKQADQCVLGERVWHRQWVHSYDRRPMGCRCPIVPQRDEAESCSIEYINRISNYESTGYSTLPSPQRLMRHCGVQSRLGRRTDRQTDRHTHRRQWLQHLLHRLMWQR